MGNRRGPRLKVSRHPSMPFNATLGVSFLCSPQSHLRFLIGYAALRLHLA
jgi:hypothetical protein